MKEEGRCSLLLCSLGKSFLGQTSLSFWLPFSFRCFTFLCRFTFQYESVFEIMQTNVCGCLEQVLTNVNSDEQSEKMKHYHICLLIPPHSPLPSPYTSSPSLSLFPPYSPSSPPPSSPPHPPPSLPLTSSPPHLLSLSPLPHPIPHSHSEAQSSCKQPNSAGLW